MYFHPKHILTFYYIVLGLGSVSAFSFAPKGEFIGK